MYDGGLFRRVDRIRFALREFDFVSTHPDHFLHVTLLPVGFVVDEPSEPDEVTATQLSAMAAVGGRALGAERAIPLDLANVNSFPAAPFIEIRNADEVVRLRNLLEGVSRDEGLLDRESPRENLHEQEFVPHLSVAYYTAAAPNAKLIETIEWFRGRPIGRVSIKSVQLATIETAVPYPPLVPIVDVPLMGN